MSDNPLTSGGVLPLEADDGDLHDRMSDKIAQELYRLIITLKLRPGAPIIEGALMRQLHCGRTPLREALQRLADDYLIRVVPRRGMTVADLGMFDLQQVYEARYSLEGLLARMATSRVSPQQLEELTAIVATMEEAGEGADLYETTQRDLLFHTRIADASGNRYLRDAFVRLNGLTARLMFFAHSHGQTIAQTYLEHKGIIDAIQTRDPDAAERVMREHIQQARERILRTLLG